MHLFILLSKDSSLSAIEQGSIQLARRISVVLLDTDPITLQAVKSTNLADDPRCDFSKLDRVPTSLKFCKGLVDRADDWCVVGMNESVIHVPRYGRHINYVFGLWDDPSNMPSFMKDFMQITKFKCPEFYQDLFDSTRIAETIGQETFREIEELVPKRRVCIADITRYHLMMLQGGMYLDLDVRVKGDMGPLIDKCLVEGVQVLLFTEHDNCDPKYMGTRENKQYTRRIYNCMFWSVPEHPIWKECAKLARERCESLKTLDEWGNDDVLWASGPDVITTVFMEQFTDDPTVLVLNSKETFQLLHHTYRGTWRRNEDIKTGETV
tara:strand:- start:365 stop:1333 length:969 start_codon:yes stop_codon:yes gene_type:complete